MFFQGENQSEMVENVSVVNDSVIESESFIEDMKKKAEDSENIIVDDLEPASELQQNGNMSVGGESMFLNGLNY